MTRKKLPAYGAALLERRRRGDHPLCVHLVFGYQWRAEVTCRCASFVLGAHPMLAIKPDDYAPERFDLSLVVGVRVLVQDQEGAVAYYEDPGFGPARPLFRRVWDLIGELAEYAAEIEVQSPVLEVPSTAHEIAFCARRRPWSGDNNGWPHWWSDSIDEKHAKRRNNWLRAAAELRGLTEACA